MKSHWVGWRAAGRVMAYLQDGRVYRSALPISPRLVFHRWVGIVYWRHWEWTLLRVFMSRKEKTVLNEGSGGVMNPVQVLHRSQQTAKLLEKAAPSKHRFAGSDGWFRGRWHSWYFCMLVYIPLSPFVWRGWLIQKLSFSFGCCPQDRFGCFEYKI